MKNLVVGCLFMMVGLFLTTTKESLAVPDYYLGDASVYAGSSTSVSQNFMFLFDVSKSMTTAGSAIKYDPSVAYDVVENGSIKNKGYISKYEEKSGEVSDYTSFAVYTMNSESSGKFNKTKLTINLSDVGGQIKYVDCEEARNSLYNNGIWSKAGFELDSNGNCITSNNTNKSNTYFTGDNASLQYELSTIALASWSPNFFYSVGDVIEEEFDGSSYKFVCTNVATDGSDNPIPSGDSDSEPIWNPDATSINDNGITWQPAQSALSVAVNVLKTVANSLGSQVRLGAAALGADANKGGTIIQPLIQPDSETNLGVFNDSMDLFLDPDDGPRTTGNHQPVNEGLWDVGTYYSGDYDFITTKNELSYPDAAQYWCQPNHIVLVTSDLNEDYTAQELTAVGNPDNDPISGSSMDVAHYLYNNLGDFDEDGNPLRVRTHVIQLFGELADLKTAADNGNGIYHSLDNAAQLETILLDLILGFLEANSSFVAPVVPASPENRAYSGKRIYLGFFKPMNDRPWYGNLKKFGLNYQNEITGFTGPINSPTIAVATDTAGNFLEDLTCDENDPMPTISSFWSTVADCNSLYPDGCSICSTYPHYDGGRVDLGGAGAKVLNTSRNIYTVVGGDTSLTEFDLDDSNAVPDSLVVALALDPDATITAEELLHFVRGYEADGSTKRDWAHGDVMHSKPVVLNYQKFDVNDPTEENLPCDATTTSDCNKGYIFVGANDGMLHAYRDATGEEAWAFIPPDLLPNLQYLTDTDKHYYFVDNSPVVYVYDKNGDGEIDKDNDNAILIFGLRRGAGSSTITAGAQGSYHALDITDPENPAYLWSVTKDTDFPDLGQTWSVPHLTRMKVGSEESFTTKIVAVIGAGYDNAEDLRHGKNRKFPADTTVGVTTSSASTGEGAVTSDGDASPASPHGQGIYVIEVAELSSSGIVTTGGGNKVWDSTVSTMYSMPSDPLIIDRNSDGYTDLIYIGDTDGQIYRFMQDHKTLVWTTTKVFESNSANEGRKIFYKPTATLNGSDVMLYFGTGDREHPLNTAVTDRFYVVRDRLSLHGGDSEPWPLDEDDLVDVTANELQSEGFDPVNEQADKDLLTSLTYTGENDQYYNGWYIDLENAGEKVLAVPKVLSGIVFFSTYQPADSAAPDPCVGNLGPSRLYAVRAMTGEAVYNLDTANDGETTDNERAKDASGNILRKDDRSINVGDGIASEPLVMINAQGEVSIMVGRGGGFFNVDVETLDPAFPIYWMKW